MRKRTNIINSLQEKRMLSIEEAQGYTGLGRTSCRAFCEEAGALKKIGGRIIIDRTILDKALDDLD